MYYFLIKD